MNYLDKNVPVPESQRKYDTDTPPASYDQYYWIRTGSVFDGIVRIDGDLNINDSNMNIVSASGNNKFYKNGVAIGGGTYIWSDPFIRNIINALTDAQLQELVVKSNAFSTMAWILGKGTMNTVQVNGDVDVVGVNAEYLLDSLPLTVLPSNKSIVGCNFPHQSYLLDTSGVRQQISFPSLSCEQDFSLVNLNALRYTGGKPKVFMCRIIATQRGTIPSQVLISLRADNDVLYEYPVSITLVNKPENASFPYIFSSNDIAGKDINITVSIPAGDPTMSFTLNGGMCSIYELYTI